MPLKSECLVELHLCLLAWHEPLRVPGCHRGAVGLAREESQEGGSEWLNLDHVESSKGGLEPLGRLVGARPGTGRWLERLWQRI